MSYLSRREGRYHYRRRFPADVAAIVGRAEFRKALGTADRAEALRLARQVSAEFDKLCEQAASGTVKSGHTASVSRPSGVEPSAVLSGLQAMVERVTLQAVQTMHPKGQRLAKTWQAELEWQERAWQAVVDGIHPSSADYHPLEAMAALKALRAVRDGSPMVVQNTSVSAEPVASQSLTGDDDSRTSTEFAEALNDYCERVSSGRASIIRKLCGDVLRWPSTQAQQVQRIMQYAEGKLLGGGKASSVHTQAAGLITVLRELPGWGGISLPKTGAIARAVRSGSGLSKDARDPMPLDVLKAVQSSLDSRGDAVDATAAKLLVRYGLRPIELLQEGVGALSERVDILGKRELVFRAGLSGAKNSASRRDLPVHDDDVASFKLVLSAVDLPETATKTQRERRARQRVMRLSAAVRIGLRGQPERLSLYSLRHTCADLLRAAGATGEEVGAVLGHAGKGSKATSIYGGTAPLDRPRLLLSKVRELLG